MKYECKLRVNKTENYKKKILTKDKNGWWAGDIRGILRVVWSVKRLTCVNTRFSELRLSRLRTKRIDWKSSWMLARNCSSSIPQVALEYRIRDWTMNLNRYSNAWVDCWGDVDRESVGAHFISFQTKNETCMLDELNIENQYIKQMLFNQALWQSICLRDSITKEIQRAHGNAALCMSFLITSFH